MKNTLLFSHLQAVLYPCYVIERGDDYEVRVTDGINVCVTILTGKFVSHLTNEEQLISVKNRLHNALKKKILSDELSKFIFDKTLNKDIIISALIDKDKEITIIHPLKYKKLIRGKNVNSKFTV